MVNKEYEKSEVIDRIRNMFKSNPTLPSISLHRFFTRLEYKRLRQAIKKSKYKKRSKSMFYSYSVSETRDPFKKTENLVKLVIERIINKKIKKIDGAVYCFEHRDYTLLHDKTSEKQGYDLIIDCTTDWQDAWGGAITYTDGAGNATPVPVSENTIHLIHRKKEIQKFVKYVNHLAKKKRYVFIGKLILSHQ